MRVFEFGFGKVMTGWGTHGPKHCFVIDDVAAGKIGDIVDPNTPLGNRAVVLTFNTRADVVRLAEQLRILYDEMEA